MQGTARELLEKFQEPKGEFVLIIQANEKKNIEETEKWEQISIQEHYLYYKQKGYSKKDCIKQVAKDRKVAKNEIYQYFLEE